MKKLAYIAAVAAVLAGCSKTETAPVSEKSGDNITLSVKLASEDGATRAEYNGAKYINFVSGDKFAAAIAKTDSPTKAVYVSYKDKAEANRYYTNFTLADENAVVPAFNGTIYSISDSQKASEYKFYGVFPAEALYTVYSEEDLTSWIVTLPNDQSAATQTSWAPKACVMLLKPSTIKCNATESYSWGEFNSVNEGETVRMGHLFGYGKVTFAGVPAEYENLVVKSVSIKAVGDDKVIAGRFYTDVTKTLDEIELTPFTKYDEITLKGDGKTTVKDYVAWFAAKPGTFDVKITVVTGKADLVFDRKGLVINRGEIAAPTVNYKTTDTVVSHDVTIAEGASWSMSKFSYSQCISSDTKAWGDSGMEKMNFSLSFPNGEENAAGSYLYSNGTYKQKLSTQKVAKIVLASDAGFNGMKAVKMNLGVYTADVTADFTVSVVNGSKSVELGKVTVAGDGSSAEGQNCYFYTTEESRNGSLVLTVDNFSADKYCIPYLGCIVINPAPEIVLGETALKVAKDASTTSIDCAVNAATGNPTVSVAEDAASWLSANYADGKVNVTVAENTGAKRSGVVTVKAVGFAESTAEITVTQQSATATEYTLTVTAADVKKAIDAALNGAEATDDYIALNASFNAKAANGKTVAVPVTFTYINYAIATDEYFTVATKSYSKQSEIKCTSAVGEISKFVVVADNYHRANSYADCRMQLSANGTKWVDPASASYVKGEDGYYTSTALNDDETMTWFDIKTPDWVKYLKVKSFEVTFVAD